MREIRPNLTSELQDFVRDKPVAACPAFPVSTYRQLVHQIARLAVRNKDHLLFYRGQGRDYRNKAGRSTSYPTIYRGDPVSRRDIDLRFEILEDAEGKLRHAFRKDKVEGYREIARKRYVRWSILQHYEVCATPLLDFTHSIRVACSFAQRGKRAKKVYVFVYGLPYVTNRISVNSEHDIVNVRLLSICPPDALRPYFQEGYLAGTVDITSDYEKKTELDFRNRLVAKFEIPSGVGFWGKGFTRLPDSVLFPDRDRIEAICSKMSPSPKSTSGPAEIGDFVSDWTNLEARVLARARSAQPRVSSLAQAIGTLREEEFIDKKLVAELDELRRFRNKVVHRGEDLEPGTITDYAQRVRDAKDKL